MNKDFHSKEITAVHLPKLCNITRGECFRVLIVMKTTFFLIILFSLKLSAGAYSQTISLSMKDGSMRKAIREIRDQSGTDFIYDRSEEHTSELQSLMRISYAVFCLKKKTKYN